MDLFYVGMHVCAYVCTLLTNMIRLKNVAKVKFGWRKKSFLFN